MTDPATCDTSVLVAAMAAWHPRHDEARRQIARRVGSIPVHVLLETFSALTRLPTPHRISPAVAAASIEALHLTILELPGLAQQGLVTTLARAGVGGGAVCDGLVAATARHHDLLLLTLDRRARTTYDALAVRYQMV